jgi:hypothetical protein
LTVIPAKGNGLFHVRGNGLLHARHTAIARSAGQDLSDTPEPPRQIALLEGVNVPQLPAHCEGVDQSAVEEVDGEAAVLPDVVAVRGAGPVVCVPGAAPEPRY